MIVEAIQTLFVKIYMYKVNFSRKFNKQLMTSWLIMTVNYGKKCD